MGISRSTWLRIPARIYTDLFRGLPAILTILLIGQGFARFSQSIFGPSPYPLGILALSLIASAYIGEIFRAGIQSVDKGQCEACRALGMSYGKAMRLVVVPQGVRRVLPALVNQFIAIVKDSILVYFLGLLVSERELFRVGQDAAVLSGNLSPLVAGRDLLPGHHRAPDPPGQLLRQPLPHRPAPPRGAHQRPQGSQGTRRGLAAHHREQHMTSKHPTSANVTADIETSTAPAWSSRTSPWPTATSRC